eukprot:s527_g19.t4
MTDDLCLQKRSAVFSLFTVVYSVEALSLEDCSDFVVHLGLPADLAPRLFAELEAENSLLATESEANTSQDMEWLVSHFGPKIETRFLLFWPQMVPALRMPPSRKIYLVWDERPLPRTLHALGVQTVGEVRGQDHGGLLPWHGMGGLRELLHDVPVDDLTGRVVHTYEKHQGPIKAALADAFSFTRAAQRAMRIGELEKIFQAVEMMEMEERVF